MDNRIFYSQLAADDLDETWNYIAKELCNESAANDIMNGILKAIEILKKFPESGAILKLPEDNISGYRFVKYGNYLVFYRTEENAVYIDRVICSRRDYLKFLF